MQHHPHSHASLLAAAQASSKRWEDQARKHKDEAARAARKDFPQILTLRLGPTAGPKERGGVYVLDEDEAPNGYPMWTHATSNNIIYTMLNGKWGIAGKHEYNRGNSNLAYIFCPVVHEGLLPNQVKCPWRYWGGGKWTADSHISVRVAQDANAPRMNVQACIGMQDELIAEYEKPGFQRRFHEAWAQAGGDEVRKKEARVLMCLPIQIKAVQKYGFEPSLKGVQQSVRAFLPFDHMAPVAARSTLMNWLVNPDMQATQCKPPPVPSNTIGHSLSKTAQGFSIVMRFLSGEELARVSIDPSENFAGLRDAVENGLGGAPLKLVSNSHVLADSETARSAGLSDGAEVFIVFLHYKVLTASADCTAKLLNTTTGESELTFTGHSACVRSAAISHDGRTIATASSDGTAMVFDAATAECKATLLGHGGSVNSAVFSLDDSKVLTASADGYAKLHSATTGECVQVFPNGGEKANSAAFSPDGRFVLIASSDGVAKLVNARTGAHVQRFGGHRDAVNSAVFSFDGLQVATASDDCTCRVFDVPTGNCAQLLLGHGGPVNWAVFSCRGAQVLSASDDCTVRLFDVVSGGCTQLFRVHEQRASAALIMPDERHVLVASSDHTVKLFHIESGDLQKTMDAHSGSICSLHLC